MKNITLYLFFFLLLAALGIIGLVLVISRLDPDDGPVNPFLFYLTLFATVLSVSTLIGYSIRRRWGQREFLKRYLSVSFRQAVWFGLILTLGMFLQANDLFSLLNAAFLIIMFVSLEAYFLTR